MGGGADPPPHLNSPRPHRLPGASFNPSFWQVAPPFHSSFRLRERASVLANGWAAGQAARCHGSDSWVVIHRRGVFSPSLSRVPSSCRPACCSSRSCHAPWGSGLLVPTAIGLQARCHTPSCCVLSLCLVLETRQSVEGLRPGGVAWGTCLCWQR